MGPVLLLALTGCDVGAASDAGVSDAGRCAAHADCDDGLFCTGTERCAPDEAGADARGCVARPACGAGEACDEASATCGAACSEPDADGDGHDAIECGGADCDDTDSGRFPGNVEICDSIDQDCDRGTVGFRDADGDERNAGACCNGEGEERLCGPDCDDADPAVGLVFELCDGRDNDCDGAVEEDTTAVDWYPDADGDGYGDPEGATVSSCTPLAGHSHLGNDCDDSDASIRRGAPERCNGRDDDCDGRVDEGDCPTFDGGMTDGGAPTECGSGETRCDGACVDTSDDELHCGGCGRPCSAGLVCRAGACGPDVCMEALGRRCADVYLRASTPDPSDGFGTMVAIDGDTMVVAAPGEDSCALGVGGDEEDEGCSGSGGAGAAYVFVRDGAGWRQQAYLKAPFDDHGIRSADISGDTIVLGGRSSSCTSGVDGSPGGTSCPDAGAAYVYFRVGDTWISQAYLKAAGAEGYERFGDRVVIDGDHIAVGAPGDDDCGDDPLSDGCHGSGGIHTFHRAGGLWTAGQYINPPNGGVSIGNLRRGSAIAISGDRMAIGDPGQGVCSAGADALIDYPYYSCHGSGAVHVYQWSGTAWEWESFIKAPVPDIVDAFGTAVALDGTRLLVGAPGEDGCGGLLSDDRCADAGAAFLYEHVGGAWTYVTYLKAPNASADRSFGASVAIDGDELLVGATGEGSHVTSGPMPYPAVGGDRSGGAYLFRRDPDWTVAGLLKADHREFDIHCGSSVALGAGIAFMGCPGENGGASGVDSDPAATPRLDDSGAAYGFETSEYCSASTCGCASPDDTCGGACRDAAYFESTLDCGACGVRCVPGASCTDGTCSCPAGETACEGACRGDAFFASSRTSCGTCGNGCAVWCDAGTCVDVASFAPGHFPSTGGRHRCAALSDGTVRCWGQNGFGQLGDGTTDHSLVPVEVSGLLDAVDVGVGDQHSCALRSGGAVVCWGDDRYGQLGAGGPGRRSTPVAVSGLTDAVELEVGDFFACARRTGGTVVCWGRNAGGRLGDTTAEDRSSPVDVFGLSGVDEIEVGQAHACARVDTAVSCWGVNNFGQVGDGTIVHRPTPAVVSGLPAATGLGLGFWHSCALAGTGVWCWGGNGGGQLGDGTTTDRHTPAEGPSFADAVEVDAGAGHSCVRLGDGSVRCWGNNYYSQLGDLTRDSSFVPVAALHLPGPVDDLAVGNHDTCGIIDGQVYCWGVPTPIDWDGP